MSADVGVFLCICLCFSARHSSFAHSTLKKSFNISSVTEGALHPGGIVLYSILLNRFFIHLLCFSNLRLNHMSLIHSNGQRAHVQKRTRDDCLKKWMSGNLYSLYNFQRRLRAWNDVNDILVRREVKRRYTFWFGDETNQTVTFALCVIIATDKKVNEIGSLNRR